MYLSVFIFVLFLAFFFPKPKTVCYGKYGCFKETFWRSKVVKLPQKPSVIGTTFHLFTRVSPQTSIVIDDNDNNKLRASNFKISRRTIFVIHGFTGKYLQERMVKQSSYVTVGASWKNWLFFSNSPFAICLNPLHPRPSLFLFGLLLLLWCFSTLVNYYFEAFFSLKVILHFAKNDLKYRDIAPLNESFRLSSPRGPNFL